MSVTQTAIKPSRRLAFSDCEWRQSASSAGLVVKNGSKGERRTTLGDVVIRRRGWPAPG